MSKVWEKVNPRHPDKIADVIAGAIVDLAYKKQVNPKIAVEILIGHGTANIIIEASVKFAKKEICEIVKRICPDEVKVKLLQVPQDPHLAKNQEDKIKCGDNGIFKGSPITPEQRKLTDLVKFLYESNQNDGKYLIND